MYREKKIEIPIYCADFIIIVTDDTKELKRRYGITDIIEGDVFAHTYFLQPKKGAFYYETHCAIFNFNRPEGANPEFPDIAHEAFHLTTNLFKQKEVKFDYDNDEPFAYMLGWFIRELTKYLYGK